MNKYPMSKPGQLGVERQFLRTGQIGGANYLGGATPITESGTTIFRLGGLANRRACAVRLSATAVTAAVSAGGTVLAKLVKYDASADAAVDLTGTIDLEALVTREESVAEVLSSVFDTAESVLDAGDALEVHVVATSTIGTQPAGLVFAAECWMLE